MAKAKLKKPDLAIFKATIQFKMAHEASSMQAFEYLMDRLAEAGLFVEALHRESDPVVTGGTVYWKNEGPTGPATHVSEAAEKSPFRGVGRPYGSPEPVGYTAFGWMSRKQAVAKANALKAKFVES